ncbi:MAG: IgGFc-binding protein [Labilithrix sp.]|nr:IgGFc-binding protein [Labilithrix sp.]
MSRVFALLAASAAVAVATLGACGSDRDQFVDDAPPPFDPADDAGASDAQCGFRCSRDLKRVLTGCGDDEGQVVAECPVGQGCGVDTCVDACRSAELSKGSMGCSFWMLPPDEASRESGAGACYASMITNTWDVPVRIDAEWGADPLDISRSVYTVTRPTPSADPVYTLLEGALPPGEVAIVFLSQSTDAQHSDPLCPQCEYKCPAGVVPAVMADPIEHGTTKTKAFHLKTDAPVSAYSIFPYGGAKSFIPSATVLLPVTSWDTGYVAVAAADFGRSPRTELHRRTIQVVANDDDTTISMRPTVDIARGVGVEAALTGERVEWTLSRGQVLQITQLDSPSGSQIVANKPVGLFGGSPCTFIPADYQYCDTTQQQIPPFSQWGTSYALVPYLTRLRGTGGSMPREQVYWSFVGAVDGTVLSYDPAKPPGAPETLAAGQVVTFRTDAIVTVASQDAAHPFHASVYMTGADYNGGAGGIGQTLGDAEFVSLVPSEQFLDRYVFFTDFTFPETSLTVVRRKTSSGFKPVALGCSGDLTGWLPLGDSGDYEYTWVRLTAGYVPQSVGDGTCGYGRHEARSDGAFGVYVWGTGPFASYGYAGGMGSRPVNAAPPIVIQ